MRRIVLSLSLLGVGLLSQPAQADSYRWCAEYGGGRGGGTNCYFHTIQQCQAAVSGNGGFCRVNGFYTGEGRSVRGSDRRERNYYR
jgi:hypothetical protein